MIPLPGRADLLTRGISQADILLSDDGINFTPFATDVAFAMAQGDNTTDFAQTVNMAGASARYVQIAVNANYGNLEYTGLSEVQFFAIPEPSSLLLAAAAPCAALLFGRRRKKLYSAATRRTQLSDCRKFRSGCVPGIPATTEAAFGDRVAIQILQRR